MLNSKKVRIAAALVAFGFVFFFFVPVVYDSTLFQCTYGLMGCLINPSGYVSVSYAVLHWGGAYSSAGGGDNTLPLVPGYVFLPADYFGLPDGSWLSSFFIVLNIAIPVAAAGVCLLAPEMVRWSRFTRIGFTIFASLVLLSSAVACLSMPTGLDFELWMDVAASALVMLGSGMLLYGLRPSIFTVTS